MARFIAIQLKDAIKSFLVDDARGLMMVALAGSLYLSMS